MFLHAPSFRQLLITVAIFCISGISVGAELSKTEKAAISDAFTKNFPQISVKEVTTTPFGGMYELLLDSNEVVYVDKGAENLLVGAKHLAVTGPGQVVDVSEQRKSKGRKEALASLNPEEAVIFKGEGESTTPIYVFTDVDCGYCRKLHEEVPELQKAGIEVQYYAWPRAGVESSAGTKMHNVWCAKDQQEAMTQVKAGRSIKDAEKECTSPLAEQLQLGAKLGVSGTPAIFTEDGRQIGGYAKAGELIEMIEQQKKQSPNS